MLILDKDSLFANLTASRSNKQSKGKDTIKGKKHCAQKFYKDLDDKDSDINSSETMDSDYNSDKEESSSSRRWIRTLL